MKRLICMTVFVTLLCGGMAAQTRSETKSYEKAIAKPSLKAYDKFLKKYPSSVYAGDISARRDTLLSISPYGFDQAAKIFADFVPNDGESRAFGFRKNAVDRIYAVRISPEGDIVVDAIEKNGNSWEALDRFTMPLNMEEGLKISGFVDSCSTFRIRDEFFFSFNLLADDKSSGSQSYISACFSPDSFFYGSVCFNGTPLPKQNEPYHIRGRIDSFSAETSAPQIRLLAARIQDNPLLEKIPDSEYYTSSAIQKWIEENPSALSSASQLHFLGIENESTLVQQFAKAKGKQESARYTAVIMDIQGYTVIVVKQKSDGQYVLAWAEPQCKDKYKDRLLNSIYFTGANTLSMQYYHGKRTFSYSLNLSNKQIKR